LIIIFKYTDLHCDTAYEIYKAKTGFNKNNLHIDKEKIKIFEKYSQIFAIWSDNDKKDDENYEDFFKIRNYLIENFAENNIILCKTGQEYLEYKENKNCAFLSVEGGKLLSCDISRLDVLYEQGVRFFTLVWNGMCEVGGAFNTDKGLTDFGKKVVNRAEELGIIIDISHSSDKIVSEVFDMTSKPVIASHSNSRTIIKQCCPEKKTLAKRNLSDEQFHEIKKRSGIVGISLCRGHLADEYGVVGIKEIIRHIDYYMALGGENTVCFGCDFDGADIPEDIKDITGISKIRYELKKIGYDDMLIENIMYKNADNFIIRNL